MLLMLSGNWTHSDIKSKFDKNVQTKKLSMISKRYLLKYVTKIIHLSQKSKTQEQYTQPHQSDPQLFETAFWSRDAS